MSMLSLYDDYSGAQTDEQRALISEAQNQLRNSYTTKNARDKQNNGYTSVYQDRIDDLTNQAVTRGSFNFNLEDNPLWGTLKKNYLREGDRAAANALAAASNASAGRPSSYAITAAQQANDYYDTQLANWIPQLYNQDYSVWADDFTRLLTNLNALREQDSSEYARFLDQLNLEYQRERDSATDKQQNFSNALAIYQLLGGASPAWVLETLGITGSGVIGSYSGDGSGGGGNGWNGGGNTPKEPTDENGNTEADLLRVQTVIDNWSKGKFGGADVNTIADTPGILEMFTEAYGGNPDTVPTDTASRRRIANQLMLDQYGEWIDRGYLKDKYGNFVRDENGNPIRDESVTPASTWTADDQRQEQMMIRRLNNVEAGMSAELDDAWNNLKQYYQEGLIGKTGYYKDDGTYVKGLYDELDEEFANGDLNAADYLILITRVNALPTDPSQVGYTGAGSAAGTTGDSANGITADEYSLALSAILNSPTGSDAATQLVRNALAAQGIDTSIMTNDQIKDIVSQTISPENGRTYTGTSQKAQNPDNQGNTPGQSNLDAAVNVIRDWGSGLLGDIQDYLRGITGAEAAASTAEGRTEAAAAIDALRNFQSSGNAAADANRLKQIAGMNQSLVYDPTEDYPGAAPGSGTIKSVAPQTGDTSGSGLAGIIGNWAADIAGNKTGIEYSDAFIKQEDMKDAYSPYANYNTGAADSGVNATGNILTALLDNIRNASKEAAAADVAGRTPIEYSDAFTKQEDMKDAYSPYASYNDGTAGTGLNQTGNLLANLLDTLRNASKEAATQEVVSSTNGRTYTGTSQKAQNPNGAGSVSANASQQSGNGSGGISLTNALTNLVSSLGSKIQTIQQQQAAAQAEAEKSAAQKAAEQAAASVVSSTNGRTYTGTSQKAQNPDNKNTPQNTSGQTVMDQVHQIIANATNKQNTSSGKNPADVVTKPSQQSSGKATTTPSAKTNTKVKNLKQ